jgi:hypothetical protein
MRSKDVLLPAVLTLSMMTVAGCSSAEPARTPNPKCTLLDIGSHQAKVYSRYLIINDGMNQIIILDGKTKMPQVNPLTDKIVTLRDAPVTIFPMKGPLVEVEVCEDKTQTS